MNLEAAEAKQNCNQEESPLGITAEPDKQNDEALIEADIDGPDELDQLKAGVC